MDKDRQLESINHTPVTTGGDQPVEVTLNQTGDDNTQIAYVENYDGSVHQTINISVQQKETYCDDDEIHPDKQMFSRDYYQLLVTYDKDIFEDNIITIPHSIPWNRVLTQDLVPDEIHDYYSGFESPGIDELKLIPAIICAENNEYNGEANGSQTAYFCRIKRIQKLNNQLKLLFEPIESFDQSILCNKRNAVFFDLDMDSFFTTLNRTAWSIHRADVFEAFKEAGVDYITP